jgi:threonine dehydrogenase-like Zn-dependent dehydrogenase
VSAVGTLKGDVPETTPGTIIGHEAVGTVQEVGAGVGTVKPGDRGTDVVRYLGADCAFEAVGVPATFELAAERVAEPALA